MKPREDAPMTDDHTKRFEMRGARDAMAKGLPHTEQQVKAIENAVDENPGLAFDLAKTLVENVCKYVLKENSIETNHTDDLPKLFKSVTNHLSFLPKTASTEASVRKSLNQTLNGLHTAVQGICELRNECGFASHGSAGARPALEKTQALLAAEASDTIVGFLYRAHDAEQTALAAPVLLWSDNSRFNAFLDEEYGMLEVGDAEFLPSVVLFNLEPETYRIYLADFDNSHTPGSLGR